jgi:p21-activated kinase 7
MPPQRSRGDRPKPMVDPSCITPIEIAEIKTIVRGDSYRGSTSSYASSRFAAPNHHAAQMTAVSVARSNSLRQSPGLLRPRMVCLFISVI